MIEYFNYISNIALVFSASNRSASCCENIGCESRIDGSQDQ